MQGTTYKAPVSVDLVWNMEGGASPQRLSKKLGGLPIMIKSSACYLRHLSRKELVKHKVRVCVVGVKGGRVGGWGGYVYA